MRSILTHDNGWTRVIGHAPTITQALASGRASGLDTIEVWDEDGSTLLAKWEDGSAPEITEDGREYGDAPDARELAELMEQDPGEGCGCSDPETCGC